MLTDVGAVRNYFAKLGFEKEIADIYLALYANGPQSISALARSSHVERTHIYRLIDTLMASNLIEVETRHTRGIVKAAPISNLHILINQKEQELKSLQDELGLIEQVLARNSLSSPASRVQFYQGEDGIHQMMWNELDAKSEIVGYGYRIPEEGTGKKFMQRWTDEFEKRKLACRLIVGDDFVDSWRSGLKTVGTGARVKGVDYRAVPSADFAITHSCTVYNDVVAYFHWEGNEVFGVEMHTPAIADTQRQLLELIWQRSVPENRF